MESITSLVSKQTTDYNNIAQRYDILEKSDVTFMGLFWMTFVQGRINWILTLFQPNDNINKIKKIYESRNQAMPKLQKRLYY